MIVIVVYARKMVGDVGGVVMVVRSTLILGVDVFQDQIAQPSAILDVDFGSQHIVLERVLEVSACFLYLPILSLSIAIVVHHQHLAIILEEMVGIDTQFPSVSVVVNAHYPRPQQITRGISIYSIALLLTARHKGMP